MPTNNKLKGRPLCPDEISELQESVVIPGEVFDIFNEAIAAKWDGRYAIVRQCDVVANIKIVFADKQEAEIISRGWLNVEEAYRRAGWKVQFERNDCGSNTFTFSKK